MESHCGAKINYVSNIIKREIENLESIQCIERLSGTNGFILVYISDQDKAVYQKDIEKEFGITRSTASKVISLMESKGLIQRKGVDNDLRLKQLILTDDAKKIVMDIKQDLSSFEERLLKGVSEVEQKLLLEILSRVEANLIGGSQK